MDIGAIYISSCFPRAKSSSFVKPSASTTFAVTLSIISILQSFTMQGAALSVGLLTFTPSVLAWGNVGHQTVAYIASDFVSAKTKSWAQKILGDTSDNYLANVATWADTYKYTSAGSFSEPFHFIDAMDSPPKTCNVDYSRDCGDDNCVVSAIVNYVRSYPRMRRLTISLKTASFSVLY